MCGFVTTISKSGYAFPEDKLKAMTRMIAHRGPDDEGFYFSQHISFGFRRLKIIDLTDNAHQPMFSEDGRHAIVFNGEIYNYREIRAELEGRGICFRSDSDTEVLLQAFITWGEKCVSKLIGMFAFSICDLHDKTVFFARDQLGIKPLFCFEDSNFIIFASEIKTLLPYTELSPQQESFNEYIVFRSLPGERTMFKEVRSILPASFGTVKNAKLSVSRYFKIEDTFNEREIDFQDACDESEKMLKESVALHLRSDVELGVQLSGGVDSSLVTALASEISGKRLHSFSISFAESEYDESDYQKRISERYNTEHHDFKMDESVFVDNLLQTIWHYEHPLNDPNTVSTYYLAKMAKEFVTVMLSGEGADESFLGYNKFLPENIRKVRLRSCLFRHSCIRNILAKYWPFEKGRSLFKVVAKYSPAMFALSYAKMELIDELIDGQFAEMIPRSQIAAFAGNCIEREVILQDEICDLQQWFWRADRAGMAASLEFRVPFCTPQIFVHANSLPYRVKLYKGEKKAVLKKIAEKYMDNDQIYRKKIGFGTPIDRWFEGKGAYAGFFEETMGLEPFQEKFSFLNQHFNSVYGAHKSGFYKELRSSFLWTYFNLQLWHRIFFEGGWRNFI